MLKRVLIATARSFLLQWYRLRFAVGARLAPHHTAARGAALFSTPIRPPARKLQLPPELSTPRLREVTLAGSPVTLYEWGDAEQQATVLLLHGWNGWALQFAAFVAPLLAQGFAVVALDFGGHGRSAGRRASLPDFIDTVLALLDHLPKLSAIVGHSLGAAAAARPANSSWY